VLFQQNQIHLKNKVKCLKMLNKKRISLQKNGALKDFQHFKVKPRKINKLLNVIRNKIPVSSKKLLNSLQRLIPSTSHVDDEYFFAYTSIQIWSKENQHGFIWNGPVLALHGEIQKDLLYSSKYNTPVSNVINLYAKHFNLKKLLLVSCNTSEKATIGNTQVKKIVYPTGMCYSNISTDYAIKLNPPEYQKTHSLLILIGIIPVFFNLFTSIFKKKNEQIYLSHAATPPYQVDSITLSKKWNLLSDNGSSHFITNTDFN